MNSKDTINIKVDMKNKKEFKHFFNAVGYANTDYTYTEPSKRMYDYLSSFNNHFQYMRMHNILTSHGKGDYYLLQEGSDYGNPRDSKAEGGVDTVVSMDEDGNLHYDWTVVDRVYDILMENEIRPIVETHRLPTCLRKSPEHHTIPKDYNLWYQLIKEFVNHLQQRYGKNEIEKWYFEIWNEPDNHDYWVEDPATFLAFYDYMVAAVDDVNPNIKVGGPAVKQGEGAKKIYRAFLQHCSKGLNFATGSFGTRVDFISVHCKGGWHNYYNPSTEVMFDSLKEYLEILKELPEYEGIEFINDESDIVWGGNAGIWKESWLNFRNTHYFPGFVCKMVNRYCDIVEDEFGANLSIVDSDNCHLQWERYLFSGNRSQFTPLIEYPSKDIVKKPAFNAYVLLSRLGNQRLTAECNNKYFGRKFGVLPTIKEDNISIMAWNFEDGVEDNVNSREMEIKIDNISQYIKDKPDGARNYKLIHYRIDREHSSSYATWDNLGKPAEPVIKEIKKIREGAGLELYETVKDITLDDQYTLKLDMPMHSVSLIILVPESDGRPAKTSIIKAEVEHGYNQNIQVFLKWKPSPDFDFLKYDIYRRVEGDNDFKLITNDLSIDTATYIDMKVSKGKTYYYKIKTINASNKKSDFSEEIRVDC